jgi:O-antigen/teichoic acid export membrane protein
VTISSQIERHTDVSSGVRQFTRNSGFGTAAGLMTALASVLASMIVARALGVAESGVVAFAMWVAMVAAAVFDFGVQASLARYLPELIASGRADEAERLAGRLWRWVAGSSVAAIIGFAGWAAWRGLDGALPAPHVPMWALVGVACALQTLCGFTFGYLRGVQRFDRLALLTAGFLACQLAGVAIGAVHFGAAGAIAGYCSGSAIPALLSLRHLGSKGLPAPALMARVRPYALFAWAGTLSGTVVWSRAELFFLQRSAGSVAVGLFTVAVTLANVAAQGPMLLTAGLLPYFAESFGRGAVHEMREAYATATRVLAFLVFPVCFGAAALLPVAVPLLYGRDFSAAVPAATVLVLAAGVGAVASVGTTLVMAMNRSDFVFVSGLLSAVLAISAGLTVIPEFGVMGAAWSRALIQVAAVAAGGGFIFWRLRFPLPLFDLTKLLFAAAACAAAARGCLAFGGTSLSLVPAIAAGAVSYGIAVRALRALHPHDAERLRLLCRVLPPRAQAICKRMISLLAPDRSSDLPLAASVQRRSAGDAD